MFSLFKKRDKITTIKDPSKLAIIDFFKEKGIISNKIMPSFYKLS